MGELTRDSWVALNVGTDPIALSRRLRRVHERGVAGEATCRGEVRDLVVESWRRSRAAGVAPGAPGAPIRLEAGALEAARAGSALEPAIDAIVGALSGLDRAARHVVAISDAQANLLWVTGESGTVARAQEMCFQEGAAWSESAAGTNAVGIAAALDHAVQIFSAEHFVAAVHDWTCAAAPIHDPITGELLGVVDLTADLRTAHPHTLSAVVLAARAAETDLHLRMLESAARWRDLWEVALVRRRGASALLDGDGRVIATYSDGGLPRRLELDAQADGRVRLPDGRVGEVELLEGGGRILWFCRSHLRVTRLKLRLLGHEASAQLGAASTERALRSLELLAVLAMYPEGLTGEQLALALYGERGKTVTIRAQVHRVRAHLGEGVLHTQPYRLLRPVDGDWLGVERLISAGRPREALRAYRGPLLPASDAPAIVEARRLLEESLRRSILTTGDPELLGRWLTHPAGADDLAAARTLVAVLPAGDPRRAAATARAAAVAKRLSPAGR